MVDLAIGVILGSAFNKVVSSLVADIIMPPLGLLLGRVDFSAFVLHLHLPGEKGVIPWRVGAFVNTLLDFTIIALVVFGVIKIMNRLRHTSYEPRTKRCSECQMEIPLKAKKCGHCCTAFTQEKTLYQGDGKGQR